MDIGSITGTAATTGTQKTGGLGALDSEAFLKLLVAQLRFQNPLEPTDPSSMMQQTAQFTQVETLQQLAKAQAQVAGLAQTSVAAGLVGKEVSATNADGVAMTGVVEAVRFSADGPLLVIGGTEVPLSSASEVRTAP
jgi:flagellar basal-body rod modification protein FlgD